MQKDTIVDFVTGKPVPDVGAEMNRQTVERLMVKEKGFPRESIAVSRPISFDIEGETYRSTVDLSICMNDITFMLVRCVAGSLDSYEREILAACRLIEEDYTVPYAVVSDGQNALVRDAMSGKRVGSGLDSIPTLSEAAELTGQISLDLVDTDRREKEKLIYRTYNSMHVNVVRGE